MPGSQSDHRAYAQESLNATQAAALSQLPVVPLASPYAGIAGVGSKHLKKAGKAAKKKKKGGWWSALGGVASFAADLVPELLPFLLANHAGTQAKVAALPPSQRQGVQLPGPVGGPGSSVAPLAYGGPPIQNLVGMKGETAIKDGKGNVTRVKVRCFDYITTLPSAAYSTGALIADWYLSPNDPIYSGTKFAMYASDYEKYSIKRVALIYVPTVPATTAGAVTGCVFADPAFDTGNLGVGDGVRIVSSQEGADTTQVWQAATIVGPRTKGLFTEPNGGDLRLTVAGKVALVCSSALAGGVSPGMIYQLTECEYSIPSLADEIDSGAGLRFQDTTTTSVTAYKPLVALSTEYILLGGTQLDFVVAGRWTDSGTSRTGNVLYGLPAGDYMIWLRQNGTGFSTACQIVTTDEAAAAGVESLVDVTFVTATKACNIRAVSIPPTVDASVPMFGFYNCTATNVSLAELLIVKMNETLFNTDAYPMAVHRFDVRDTCRVNDYYRNKRLEFYRSTGEGAREEQLLEMKDLKKSLLAMQAQLAAAGGEIYQPSYLSATSAATLGLRSGTTSYGPTRC